ncbi:MAG: ABC transporter permease [Anaerolineales bacterium]|nr:ABC transporter permease [Anaerolineales bacterium]
MGVILKNLLRRKSRTLLTVLGISIGVAAIIGLGALSDQFKAGYLSMLAGTKSDLILSQPNTMDISYSAVDESIGAEIQAMPEVSEVSGLVEGFITADEIPLLFLFGYPEDSFILDRFQIVEGVALQSREAKSTQGTPLLLGRAAAESVNKGVGETLRIQESVYRIIGIYETGDAFEDGGAVLALEDAQELLGKVRQVSIFYIRLRESDQVDRVIERVNRRWPDLSIQESADFASGQAMVEYLDAYVWAIAGLAIAVGGVGMMNAQLMSVMERTREIGVLRAVGWSKSRVLGMILGESLLVSLLGGLVGIVLGWLSLLALSGNTSIVGDAGSAITPDRISQAFVTVLGLGAVGGGYPAWRAAKLAPIEALRYEGGTMSRNVRRLSFGGISLQSLWQRGARTLLTLLAVALTVGSIMALQGIVDGAAVMMMDAFGGSGAEILIRQADVADTSMSTIDERISERIAVLPEVESVSGMIMSAVMLPEEGTFFILLGYAPNEAAIREVNVVEGQRLTGNHQIMIGRSMADSMNKSVGETIELGGSRFRIVGIYSSDAAWEELGGVISLRDAQNFIGKPRKVTILAVNVLAPETAEALRDRINTDYPEVHAGLSGEFAQQTPDMANANSALSGISVFAILVGGVGVLNTMLMTVLERTREIGVFRALGWKKLKILRMILEEGILLGLIGGLCGVLTAFILTYSMTQIPMFGDALDPVWKAGTFMRAFLVSLCLGLLGGLYPAWRATRLQPVEALRYE